MGSRSYNWQALFVIVNSLPACSRAATRLNATLPMSPARWTWSLPLESPFLAGCAPPDRWIWGSSHDFNFARRTFPGAEARPRPAPPTMDREPLLPRLLQRRDLAAAQLGRAAIGRDDD